MLLKNVKYACATQEAGARGDHGPLTAACMAARERWRKDRACNEACMTKKSLPSACERALLCSRVCNLHQMSTSSVSSVASVAPRRMRVFRALSSQLAGNSSSESSEEPASLAPSLSLVASVSLAGAVGAPGIAIGAAMAAASPGSLRVSDVMVMAVRVVGASALPSAEESVEIACAGASGHADQQSQSGSRRRRARRVQRAATARSGPGC